MAHQATADPEFATAAPAQLDAPVRVGQPHRRHPPRPLLLGLLVCLVAVIAAATWRATSQSAAGPLTASGTVEFDEVTLAAESAGRIADLSVGEGNRVSEGQV